MQMWPYEWGLSVYLHGGVHLHMCKLTFTYMQLRSHPQKYIRVQIIYSQKKKGTHNFD